MSGKIYDQVTTRMIDVTPSIAKKWLLKNNHNRPMRRRLVEKYARDMKGGRWKLSHQGIAFNCDGTILDGQHRLAAIVESGVTIKMLVTEGVPVDSQIIIDDHAKRNPYDAIFLAKEFPAELKRDHVTIASAMIRMTKNARMASKQEISEFLQEHFEAIDFVVNLNRSKRRGITQASVLAVIARAWYTSDHEKLSRFMSILHSGEISDKSEVAAITIRDWLLRPISERTGAGFAMEIYRRTERLLKAFLDGEELRRCTAASEELFPIASDKRKELKSDIQ